MPFDALHQILFWPLEISSKERISGNYLADWAGKIHEDSAYAWQKLDPYDRGTTDKAELRYSEFVYFHPFVQGFLYPSESGEEMPLQHLQILKRTDVSHVRVKLSGVDEEEILKVDRIHLYLFPTQVAILVVEVRSLHPFDRRTTLQFLDQFRRAYGPYWSGGKAGNCPEKVEWLNSTENSYQPIGKASDFDRFDLQRRPVENAAWRRPPVAAHWNFLLQGLKPSVPFGVRKQDDLYFDQIEDDRIPCMQFLANPSPHEITDADMVRLCFLDSASDDASAYPYSPGFLGDFPQRYSYDRYWDRKDPQNSWMATRYLCCGYSFTMLGASGNNFYRNEEWGLLSHFRHHYFQLGLLAHFHRASLLRFSSRFSLAIQQKADMRDLNRDFATFVTGYWFNEVSNQLQGREIFDFWSERLNNQKLFDHVSAEKRLAAELQTAQEMTNDGKRVKKLTVQLTMLTCLLVPLTLFAVVVAFLDMDFIRTHIESWKPDLWAYLILAFMVLFGGGVGYLIKVKRAD